MRGIRDRPNPESVHRSRSKRPVPKWLRPPLVPLVYLVFVALPLSVWASPGVEPRAIAVLAASFALLLLVSATAGRGTVPPRRPPPAADLLGPAPPRQETGATELPEQPCHTRLLAWARVYFAMGAVVALFHGHFQDNELAGIMLLFLPLAAVLARCPALSGVRRLQAGLLVLLFGGTLLAAGSRGGLLALGAAAGVILIFERRWRLLLCGLLLAGVLVLRWQEGGPAGHAIDWLIHDGKVQGVTLDSLFTGRPQIWRRSLHAIADFPLTGIGAGRFSEVVPVLYYPPGSRSLEHAHSLVLQTALDLGVGGLLAMAALVWVAACQSWRAGRNAPAATVKRAWALGLFASLSAFCAFNLFDAVAFGTPGGVAFFVLLGLIYALPKPRPARRRWRWRLPARGPRRLLLGAILMLLGLSSVRGARELNRASVLAARAAGGEHGLLATAHAALDAAGRRACRAGWLEGKVAQAWDRPRLRDAAWADLLGCSAAFVPMIAGELPAHRRFAERAVELQPSSAAAHFWLARVRLGSGDRASAEWLYRRGLELDPSNALAWIELGRLLASGDPRAALDAFTESCRRGDPGANACLAAGAAAERLGDLELAVHWYLKSRLGRARERAEELSEEQPGGN